MPDRFTAEVLKIVSFGDEPMNERERLLGGLFVNRGDQLIEDVLRHNAQKLAHLRVGDMVAAVRESLLEQRERIAEAAFGCASHHRNCAGIDF